MAKPKFRTTAREYGDGLPVEISQHDNGRPVIVAYNEAGYNHTIVDLEDMLQWIASNMPEMLHSNDDSD